MNIQSTVAEILAHLRKHEKTISTAESITAGHLQSMLASVSGSSDVFNGGITAYKRPVKVELLGVDETLAIETDCVNKKIAEQMACGALKLFRSDYSIATCGYAAPYPEQQITQPFAYIAIAEHGENRITIRASKKINLQGNRVEAQQQAATEAISMVRNTLLKEA